VCHCDKVDSLANRAPASFDSAWDSGAPLIQAGDSADHDLLVGLGSTGIGCADPIFPSIQARISADSDWIDWMVCQLSVDPPKDFRCDEVVWRSANWTADATVPTSIPGNANALLAATMMAPTLFGQATESFGLAKDSFLLVVGLVVLVGAVGIRRVARRAHYTPL